MFTIISLAKSYHLHIHRPLGHIQGMGIGSFFEPCVNATTFTIISWAKPHHLHIQRPLGHTKEISKGESVLFDLCTTAMGKQPYWLSHIYGGELLYLRVWMIIPSDLQTLLFTARFTLCNFDANVV